MAAILWTLFSNIFCCIALYALYIVRDDKIKMLSHKNTLISIEFHWSWLLQSKRWCVSVDLDNGLAPNRRQAIIWTSDDLVYWRIYSSLGISVSVILLILNSIKTWWNNRVCICMFFFYFITHDVDIFGWYVSHTKTNVTYLGDMFYIFWRLSQIWTILHVSGICAMQILMIVISRQWVLHIMTICFLLDVLCTLLLNIQTMYVTHRNDR